MCWDCWEKHGAPRIGTPAVLAAAGAIRRVYENPYAGTGGGLHVVVDDFNVDDKSLADCRDAVLRGEPFEGEDDDERVARVADERACLEALERLTVAERASALGLVDGFWGTAA